MVSINPSESDAEDHLLQLVDGKVRTLFARMLSGMNSHINPVSEMQESSGKDDVQHCDAEASVLLSIPSTSEQKWEGVKQELLQVVEDRMSHISADITQRVLHVTMAVEQFEKTIRSELQREVEKMYENIPTKHIDSKHLLEIEQQDYHLETSVSQSRFDMCAENMLGLSKLEEEFRCHVTESVAVISRLDAIERRLNFMHAPRCIDEQQSLPTPQPGFLRTSSERSFASDAAQKRRAQLFSQDPLPGSELIDCNAAIYRALSRPKNQTASRVDERMPVASPVPALCVTSLGGQQRTDLRALGLHNSAESPARIVSAQSQVAELKSPRCGSTVATAGSFVRNGSRGATMHGLVPRSANLISAANDTSRGDLSARALVRRRHQSDSRSLTPPPRDAPFMLTHDQAGLTRAVALAGVNGTMQVCAGINKGMSAVNRSNLVRNAPQASLLSNPSSFLINHAAPDPGGWVA